MNLNWDGVYNDYSGYGTQGRNTIKVLKGKVNLTLSRTHRATNPVEDPEILVLEGIKPQKPYINIHHSVPTLAKYDKNAQKNVLFTMFESDNIPDTWADHAAKMDEIWVPTPWNVYTFHRKLPDIPMHTVPLGINKEVFRPDGNKLFMSNAFVFVTVMEWTPRKNPKAMIEAYLEEFAPSDNVLFVFKVFINYAEKEPMKRLIMTEVEEIVKQYKSKLAIKFIFDELSIAELAMMYRACNCFVIASRGEGWGLPPVEASCCGLPVVYADSSSLPYVLSDKFAFPVKGEYQPITVAGLGNWVDIGHIYVDGKQKWFEVDKEDLKRQMRYVYEHQEECRKKNLAGWDTFPSWEDSANRIMELCEGGAG